MTDFSDNNRFAPPRADLAEPDSFDGLVLGGRGARLVAVILDGILISLIIWPLYFVFGGGTAAFAPTQPPQPMDVFGMMGKMFSALLPGYVVVGAIQGWLMHVGGQTMGKKLMGLRVVRRDGNRAGFVRLFFARGGISILPGFVPLLGMLWTLLDSVLIFRDSRQCLHDQICDTLVVTAESSKQATLAAARGR